MLVPILGTIVPNMGTNIQSSPIADALFPKVRQRVLAALFGQPERSFYTKELMRLADSGIGAVQRELAALEGCGLITSRREGNQKHYQANPNSPIYGELRGLITKSFGITDTLRQALEPLSDRITLALLYGSMASGEDHAGSDADVLIIADDLTLEDVFGALASAEQSIGRTINPTVYTKEEFRKRRDAGNPFISRLLSRPYVILKGSEDAGMPNSTMSPFMT